MIAYGIQCTVHTNELDIEAQIKMLYYFEGDEIFTWVFREMFMKFCEI